MFLCIFLHICATSIVCSFMRGLFENTILLDYSHPSLIVESHQVLDSWDSRHRMGNQARRESSRPCRTGPLAKAVAANYGEVAQLEKVEHNRLYQ